MRNLKDSQPPIGVIVNNRLPKTRVGSRSFKYALVKDCGNLSIKAYSPAWYPGLVCRSSGA